MNKLFATAAAVGVAALALLGGLGSGRASAADVNGCPQASSFTDPWLLVSAGDGSVRLADRDGDGSVCVARVVVRGRVLATLITDNAIGNPNIIPPGPCTNPFESFEIGNPGIFPAAREIDANGDGTLCGTASLSTRALIIILLDNPNAVVR